MKINFLDFYLFSVPVNFDLACLKILFSNHLIIKLEYNGKIGIGEGVLYRTSLLKTKDLLLKEFKEFFQQQFLGFKQVKNKLFKDFYLYPGVVCAFDLALWDLQAKFEKKSVSQYLASARRAPVKVVEQIFIPKNKIQLIKETKKILAHKTQLLKLKAGRNINKDLKNIELIQQISKGQLDIQVDLNQALDYNQAVFFGKQLIKLGILAWEEPISFRSFQDLKKLKRKIKLPLVLDESIRNLEDLEKAVQAQAIDIINIKLSRLGGLTNSLKLINFAHKNKLKIEIGCSEDLGIATSAQIHLAKSDSKLRAIEALGAERLGFDIIKEKIKIKKGYLKLLHKKFGLGVNFDPPKLRQAGKKFSFSIITKHNPKISLKLYFGYIMTKIIGKIINGVLFFKNKLLLWEKG